MLHFIICLAIAIWSTSSLFMLIFWVNSFITIWNERHEVLIMPFGFFLFTHFCPIVHTVQCFKIMKRIAELQAEKRRV